MQLYYDPKLKHLAKKLRKNMTLPEVLLWNQLKGKKLGYDFHRQKPIGHYIADFYCPKLKLIIEVDGQVHLEKGEYDMKRQSKLESIGLHILRFTATDILKNLNDVIDSIATFIDRVSSE